jgi:hypothetical protein
MRKMMKIISTGVVVMAFTTVLPAQRQLIKEKLQDFFFAIPFDSDIEVIKLQLSQDPDFKIYEDPNRDSKKTIVGTLLKDKSLNPVAFGNQLIILYLSNGKRKKNISIKWSMNYKLEDLPSAVNDFEKINSEFKPLFTKVIKNEKIGQHREQISSLKFKEDALNLTITLIKYNNFIHTVSVEYSDRWKIEPVTIMKVRY